MPDSTREFYKYKIDNLSEDVSIIKEILILGTGEKESLLSRVRILEDNIGDITEIKTIVNNICEKLLL